ncbi:MULTISPECIES: hypothetical protein [Pseudomonas]|uniref:hypothetical protein n=1 Tax=Pseudomonas TaxID=286 RepID=UPI001E4CF43C|nr:MULTISPECIES: hypothetical protein [Pseudomonas]
MIVSKALDDALLGVRHDFEEWHETVTFLINLAAAPAEETARLVIMSRPSFEITEKQPRQLEEFSKTGLILSAQDRLGRIQQLNLENRVFLRLPK